MNTFDTNIEVINDVYQGLAKPLSEIKQPLTGTQDIGKSPASNSSKLDGEIKVLDLDDLVLFIN